VGPAGLTDDFALPFFPQRRSPTPEFHRDVALRWRARSCEVLARFPWRAVSRWDGHSILGTKNRLHNNLHKQMFVGVFGWYVIGLIFTDPDGPIYGIEFLYNFSIAQKTYVFQCF